MPGADWPPVQTDEATWVSDGIVADVRRGLLDDPKWLSSLYFYDEAGSRLFEQICETPEYYPTRTEHRILRDHGDDILAAAGDEITLAELGSGSSIKTRTMLRALLARQGPSTYLPVDISGDFLAQVAIELESSFDGLHVDPIAAEYHVGLDRIGEHDATRRLVLFLGSSIGNFEPDEQEDLLRRAHAALRPGDAFLLGTDLVKDPTILEAAYDDDAGVTAAFNKNILTHLHRELGGHTDLHGFDHRAVWNADRSRIEMHLVSKGPQRVAFPKADVDVALAAGETIHTENSYKFTTQRVQELADASGWTLETTWTDPDRWFALHLLRR